MTPFRTLFPIGLLAALAACGEFGIGPGGRDEPEDPNDKDGDGFFVDEDCDDNDARVYPGAPEVCGDGRITDCDRTDEIGAVSVGPLAFQDLQAGLDGTPPNRELLVCPGTYVGTFTAPKPIKIRALEGPEVTILKGTEQGTTLTVRGGTEVIGFTIQNGNDEEGGGLTVLEGGELIVDNCLIEANAAVEGGGIYGTPDATIRLRNNTIVRDNRAVTNGGGVYLGNAADLVMDETCIIELNSARTGGGVFLQSGTIEGGEISGNFAIDDTPSAQEGETLPLNPPGGGGVAAYGTSTLRGTAVSENEAIGASAGGGLVVLENDELTLDNVEVRGNQSATPGGGIAIVGGIVRLEEGAEIFSNSSSAGRGGGVAIEGGQFFGGIVRDNRTGGGISVREGSVVNVDLEGNANAGEGGAIQARGNVSLTNLRIQKNQAALGGGVHYVRDPGPANVDQALQMENVGLRENQAAQGAGGGLYASAADLVNCEIVQNSANQGAGIFVNYRLSMAGGSIQRNLARPTPDSDSGGALLYIPNSGEAIPETPVALNQVAFGSIQRETQNQPNDVTFVGRDGMQTCDYFTDPERARSVTLDCTPKSCDCEAGPPN